MATGKFPQQYPTDDPSPDGVGLWTGLANPLIGIEEYLRLDNPVTEDQYQTNPYQSQGEYIESYQPQGTPAQPNQAPSLPQGYYPALPYKAELNKADHTHPNQEQNLLHDEECDTDDDPVRPAPQRLRKRKAKVRAYVAVEDGQPRSKRAERRAKIVEEHGAVGATDTPKGKTREQDGVTEWYDIDQNIWRPAAPLDDYRHEIILEDNALGSYDYPPDHGHHIDDVTTFPPGDDLGQSHWNFHDRNSWGDIQDAEGNEVMYLIDRPETDIETPDPGFMMYDDMVMLDPDDHPIIDWPGIPRCFSSQIEGARIEALRRVYPWLGLPHFRARMPRQVHRKQVGIKPLFGISSLTQRLSRFRESYDVPPWKRTHVNKGADLIRHTKARLAEEGLEPDSTAGLQPLSRKEILRRKQTTKGQFPENRGIYTLTEGQRKEKEEREAKRHREKKEKAKQDDDDDSVEDWLDSIKRKRNDSTTPDVVDQPLPKRHRQPSGFIKSSPLPALPLASRTKRVPPYRTMSPRHMPKKLPRGPCTPLDLPVFHQYTSTQPTFHSAPATVALPQPTPTDFRLLPPLTLTDQLAIKTALSYTILDYQYFHDCAPPATTSTAAYLTQYQEIKAHHRQNWFVTGLVPQLVGLEGWFGGFGNVPVPRVREEVARKLLSVENNDTSQPTITEHTKNSWCPSTCIRELDCD